MKFVTSHFSFGTGRLGDYDRLFEVFKKSVEMNSPHEIVELQVTIGHQKGGHTESVTANHYKMVAWNKYIQEVDDDCILIDCDMMILHDMAEAFEKFDFDVAITKRNTASIPYNGGVVFVRNTKQAKNFIKLWYECDQQLYNDRRLHARYRHKYKGMNQAALGYLLEEKRHQSKLIELPCSIYNAVEQDWKHLDPEQVYAVHCKAGLKRAVLSSDEVRHLPDEYQIPAQIWRDIEATLDKV